MNYINGYGNSPYFNNMNYIQPIQQNRQEIIKVNGRNGAEAYQMSQNSSVLLLDEQHPIVWLKTTDGAGYASVVPYSITPYKQEEPVNIKSLEERIAKLEGVINGKSYINNASEQQQNE